MSNGNHRPDRLDQIFIHYFFIKSVAFVIQKTERTR